jgi:hypothetical protein
MENCVTAISQDSTPLRGLSVGHVTVEYPREGFAFLYPKKTINIQQDAYSR